MALLTTSLSNIITNASGSNTVAKINNIVVSNYTTVGVSVNVSISRSGNSFYLGGNVAVPANSTLVLLGKDTATYLEEGDILQAYASANTSATISSSYEIIG